MRAFRERHRTLLTYLATVMVVLAPVNFFWFVAESSKLGGDAGGGYVRDGRYFVGSHGKHIEVSRDQWEWSRFRTSTIFPIHLLGMVAMGYLLLGELFPALLRSSIAPGNDLAVQEITNSGPELASAACGGQIGSLSASRGLLRATVYPGGVVVRPVLHGRHRNPCL